MASCKEIVNETALAEQQDEITALEAIFQQDFRLVEDDDELTRGRISFDLSLRTRIPHKEIKLEAVVPVETEQCASSGSDSEVLTEKAGNCGDTSDLNADVVDGVGFDGDGATGATTATDCRLSDTPDSLLGSASASSPSSGKPRFARSLSLQHWYIQAEVQYLTPIHLRCTFSNLYPVQEPPDFSLSCLWLNNQQIQELCRKLKLLWEEMPNQPIVFVWAEWLQDAAYEHLALVPHLLLRQIVDENPELAGVVHTKLETALLAIFENDLEMRRDEFMHSRHICEICFSEKDGQEFHFFDECKHFFCTECLTAHCDMHIESGSVLKLLCPYHECKVVIPPDVLRDILDSERYDRWERLLLSKTLDTMGDIVYCPRCNVPVVADDDESTKLAQCASCFYAFCTECHAQWHHGKPCWLDDEKKEEPSKTTKRGRKKKRKDEDAASSDDDDNEQIKRGKGLQSPRRNLTMNSMKFIRNMRQMGKYKTCPKCKMLVERISGCDMMHCSQCSAKFCWSCGKAIGGYSHFGSCSGPAAQRDVIREPTAGEKMIEKFRTTNPGKSLRIQTCPRCHQKNLKESNNNHLKCWACKTDFCYQCGKAIKGLMTSHFVASSPCTQHSE